jgi:2-haloacid dehalogenase
MLPKNPVKNPSHVIFDLGGVLIDWDPRHLYRKLIPDPVEMERFLGDVATPAWHGAQDRGGDPAEATRRLQVRHPDKAGLIGAFYARFDEMLEHEIPAMARLVERLHAAGVPLYLLSNAPAFLETWVRGNGRSRHRFIGLFRDYVVSGAVGSVKPQAAIFELACKRGGFAAEDAVFIDDSLPNVEGARAAGLHAVHHRTADDTAAALRALGLPA